MVSIPKHAPESVQWDERSWRAELCRSAAKVSTFLYGIATVLLALMIRGRWQHAAATVVSFLCFVSVGALVLTRRPRGGIQAWLVVGPAVVSSLLGFATIGFITGPSVLTTVTIMLAGLLLGRRAMGVLLGTVVLGVGSIGWAMTHGVIAPPHPKDVSMLEGLPWIRAVVALLMGVGLLGTLLVEIVGRMERSLEQVREQTRLRDEAEQARARAEAMAMANKQLEMIGQLAAGIAHDFNNNLAATIGSAELMKIEFGENRIAPDLLEDILTSSRRAAELTKQLLMYSRKAQVVLVSSDLHQLIDSTVGLLRRSIDPKVQLETRLNAENAHVLADGSMLDNLLLNLLVNARDAMPHGGRITVATSSYEVPFASSKHEQGLLPGEYILIEVLDTGEGIASDVLPHIFEPFFSTKPVGEGTGLGLAAVAGAIKALKGSIEVESEPGCGTAFRILLPSHAPAASTVTREVAQVKQGAGHILLVDDDALVRRAATATLRSLGYEVTSATDGVDGVEVFGSSTEQFDLVILDLRMPRMNGITAYEKIRGISVTVPVLIWSGYGGDAEVESVLKNGAAGFIQKPYAIAELSRVVYAAINGSREVREVASAS